MDIEFIYPRSTFDYFISTLITLFTVFIGLLPILAMLSTVFVHELGHYIFAKHFNRRDVKLEYGGYKGAVSYEEETTTNIRSDMLITLSGPIFGLLCSVPFALLYYTTNIPSSQISASITAIVLVNIIALSPLQSNSDGRRALSLYYMRT